MTVLVFDDSIEKLMDIRQSLNHLNIYDIITVRNVEDGLDVLDCPNIDVDLIISDMNYPLEKGMMADSNAGLKLIKILKNNNRTIPLIICSTGDYRDLDKEFDFVLGNVCYRKNVDLDIEFKKLINNIVKRL